MPLIALTGGIASGKSTIAGRLAELGAVVVDADQIVRDVQTEGSPVLDAIAAEFGDEMIDASGALDRARLGRRVFGDADALARLNAIVHPAVLVESRRRFEEAFENDPDAVVVYDVPLLAEARGGDAWDLIVVADAPPSVRVDRMVRLRGMTQAEARRRIAAQIDDAQRRSLADIVIDTSGEVAETLRQTDAAWERIRDA